MVNPNDIVEINGVEMMIRDIPDQTTRAFYGYGHFPDELKNRQIHPGIGLYDSDVCRDADNIKGVWINYGENLVCQGCGMDFT